ncbi:MAG: hypothetical protein P3W87_001540 [Gammaproteobacteria bacterium]|nr:hypothetical protein [Gammaproteobacteria bacterium]
MSKDPPDPPPESTSAPGLISLHGVFLALRLPRPLQEEGPKESCRPSLGVLILGSAGIGKSELALDLVSRGHALIADDSPMFTQQADGRWLGRCPFPLQDFLEVRGLGILNIRRLFGDRAVCAEHPLDFVIRLEETPSSGPPCLEERLEGAWRDYRLGDAAIPELPLTVRIGRNLALLVETAARLRACGAGDGIEYNDAFELSRRLEEHLSKESL